MTPPCGHADRELPLPPYKTSSESTVIQDAVKRVSVPSTTGTSPFYWGRQPAGIFR